ncbi:TRAP transporter large permease [Celeribacter indicus]|uniref:TRAP transporter large permease protein n=1 Tax=Celeribacter indicus TaxID=1208324 RepID=A0A0B5E2U1_9RHOB|nr:TRAP transporter large permease [Celeribacter indicus]AJE46767.1 TRAP dicarboxylate transporter subunit DctM [Celeribacter indicus]SDX05947.1 TRAP transporter, DctM subunit [Celeribacter indicus]
MSNFLLLSCSVLFPLLLGFPIALVLGGVGLAWIVALDPNLLRGAARAVWNIAGSYTLISIPLFLLMGEIFQRSGSAERFYNALAVMLRRVPGGLLHANITASALFAAISGSSVATAACIGRAALPNLRALGYAERPLLGTLAAGGSLGILIPPSIALVIYAALVDESLGRLMVAAIVPGFLLTLLMMVYILVSALITPPARGEGAEIRRERVGAAVNILPIMGIIAIIFCGLYFGWATPVELAALGVLLTAIFPVINRKRLWPLYRDAVISAVRASAMLLFIVVCAQIFSFAVFSWGFTYEIVGWVEGLELPGLTILLTILVIYFILGAFMDELSTMVMTLPLVYPIVTNLGYSGIWFGVVLIIMLQVGLNSPPVGMNLFVIQGIDPRNTKLSDAAVGVLPYIVIMLLFVGLLIAFPGIALWLPARMM